MSQWLVIVGEAVQGCHLSSLQSVICISCLTSCYSNVPWGRDRVAPEMTGLFFISIRLVEICILFPRLKIIWDCHCVCAR